MVLLRSTLGYEFDAQIKYYHTGLNIYIVIESASEISSSWQLHVHLAGREAPSRLTGPLSLSMERRHSRHPAATAAAAQQHEDAHWAARA